MKYDRNKKYSEGKRDHTQAGQVLSIKFPSKGSFLHVGSAVLVRATPRHLRLDLRERSYRGTAFSEDHATRVQEAVNFQSCGQENSWVPFGLEVDFPTLNVIFSGDFPKYNSEIVHLRVFPSYKSENESSMKCVELCLFYWSNSWMLLARNGLIEEHIQSEGAYVQGFLKKSPDHRTGEFYKLSHLGHNVNVVVDFIVGRSDVVFQRCGSVCRKGACRRFNSSVILYGPNKKCATILCEGGRISIVNVRWKNTRCTCWSHVPNVAASEEYHIRNVFSRASGDRSRIQCPITQRPGENKSWTRCPTREHVCGDRLHSPSNQAPGDQSHGPEWL